MKAIPGDVVAAFHAARKFQVVGNECHEWSGSRSFTGYGLFVYKGRNYLAHRVAWQLINGPIPSGMFVMHRCDNPPCVNPEHLTIGTHADNSRDMVEKGRSTRGRYRRRPIMRTREDFADEQAWRDYQQQQVTQQYAREGRVYTGMSAIRARMNARQRQRYASDPEYRAKVKAHHERWRQDHPDRWQQIRDDYYSRLREIKRRERQQTPEWQAKQRARRDRRARTEERERIRSICYNLSEIAQLAGVNKSTAMRWVDGGKLSVDPDGARHGLKVVSPETLFPFLARYTECKERHERMQ